jgi:Lrp/AsnC family transcriptional regulator, leucine-responsive regulatory protein
VAFDRVLAHTEIELQGKSSVTGARPGRGLDRIDRRILRALQEDGRLSITVLADRIGLSATPCSERVKRLERDGFISGYHARLNPHALGQSLLVFVEIRLSAKSGRIFDDFKREVLKLPNVLECHLVSGDFDYLIKARIPEMNAYRKLLGDMLLALPGARESRSYVVMEEIKESLALTIDD